MRPEMLQFQPQNSADGPRLAVHGKSEHPC